MLDRCPGCASEVSDTAVKCPGCGFQFVADAAPPTTHGDVDNDPVLDGPASLDNDEPRLDGPASEAFSNEDLLAIQTGGILPRSMEADSYEAPQRAAPPKSQAAGFVIAGLCIAAMAASSYYFKHQKAVEAERVAVAEAKTAAEQARALIAAERAAAEKAAQLAKEMEEERIAKAAAEVRDEDEKKSKRRRRKGRRSNELEAPNRPSGFGQAAAAAVAPQPSEYGSMDIPTTDSGTPDYGSDFRVKGAVYDLYSMEPVGEADVVFNDLQTGKQLSTVTDDSGVFRAHLPINGKGYSLKIRHSRYEPKYIEDAGGQVKSMSADQRRSEGADLLRTMGQQTTFNATRKTLINRDFMLVPR